MPASPMPAAMDGERGLALLVRDCVATGAGRRALLLNLSRLPVECSKPHHRRLTRQALEPLTMADRARVFELGTGDMAVVWRGPAEVALRRTLRQVQALFDGLTEAPGSLTQLMDLPRDADQLLLAMEARVAANRSPRPPAPAALRPLDGAGLDHLERVLGPADLARFARRQPIWAWSPGQGQPRRAWEKRFLSLGDLAAELMPGHDLRAEPWLFRRLSRTLDRRLLALLSAPDELNGAGPFAIDLNVASILSADFLRFDSALPARLRGHVQIDFDPPDLLADPAAFAFARDFARCRKYRLGLKHVTGLLLRALPLQRTGLDRMLLGWTPELAPLPAAALASAAGRDGEFVLCGSDDATAIAWGRDRGISLFQGSAARLQA